MRSGEKQRDDDDYRNDNFPPFHLCVSVELRILDLSCRLLSLTVAMANTQMAVRPPGDGEFCGVRKRRRDRAFRQARSKSPNIARSGNFRPQHGELLAAFATAKYCVPLPRPSGYPSRHEHAHFSHSPRRHRPDRGGSLCGSDRCGTLRRRPRAGTAAGRTVARRKGRGGLCLPVRPDGGDGEHHRPAARPRGRQARRPARDLARPLGANDAARSGSRNIPRKPRPGTKIPTPSRRRAARAAWR